MNLRYFEKCYLNHPVILQDYSVIIVTVIFAISQYAKWLDVYCSSHFIKCDLCGLETANYATIHGWKYRHPSMYSRSTYTLNNTETTNPRMHSVQWLTLKLCSFYCLSTTVCLFFHISDENIVNLNLFSKFGCRNDIHKYVQPPFLHCRHLCTE